VADVPSGLILTPSEETNKKLRKSKCSVLMLKYFSGDQPLAIRSGRRTFMKRSPDNGDG
jgi:hypothetical protein